jgi:hypothetical protein
MTKCQQVTSGFALGGVYAPQKILCGIERLSPAGIFVNPAQRKAAIPLSATGEANVRTLTGVN